MLEFITLGAKYGLLAASAVSVFGLVFVLVLPLIGIVAGLCAMIAGEGKRKDG